MGTMDALQKVVRVAGTQHGLLTQSQAAMHAITRVHLSRLVAAGDLTRVIYGVYATPDAADDAHTLARAHWLALEPGRLAAARLADPVAAGVLSHRTAAAFHDLPTADAEQIEITLPTRYRTRRRGLIIHRAVLDRDEVVILDDLPVTSVDRTLRDITRTTSLTRG